MTTAPDAVDASLHPGPPQLRLAELAAPVCDRLGLALAGGHALRAHGVPACAQDGLTLVTSGETDLPEAAADLSAAYRAAGGGVAERPGTPRLEQLSVRLTLGGRSHTVELRKEPLGHRPVRLDLGAPAPGEPAVAVPVVALEDAAALTTALLVDRGMPRDLIDVHALTAWYQEGELLALATALDADFQPTVLADRLETLAEAADGRFRARGLPAGAVDGLKRWALAWSQDLRLDLLETQEAPDGLHDPYLEAAEEDADGDADGVAGGAAPGESADV
ncbi:nucleotidyl transferase AbiEii/AbiGii toxin family protein [Kitasatospora sp. CM 4170]|uniref:Nucleotidyl transferase AbiEii/AbiGii toxin family protein n=1 Tax=Kitasatospora aburaviensis TaxID=67265 RepID=A0ABW1F2Z7_9ACTN|nr:nucleotidyl transferase AbiEii/AbiGii toxin family protein [Kitasatospora sp. CM 4170]WNM47889.1 nucleotidyl transferase AbiEii/AbiGii toxin family protein [Kitasatospora sp. CM 4170]